LLLRSGQKAKGKRQFLFILILTKISLCPIGHRPEGILTFFCNEAYARLVIDQRELLVFYATKKKAQANATEAEAASESPVTNQGFNLG
jgi:hypothetical protein